MALDVVASLSRQPSYMCCRLSRYLFPLMQIEDAMKREEQQFDRLHFALQKARSDAARMGVLQAMLDSRK